MSGLQIGVKGEDDVLCPLVFASVAGTKNSKAGERERIRTGYRSYLRAKSEE